MRVRYFEVICVERVLSCVYSQESQLEDIPNEMVAEVFPVLDSIGLDKEGGEEGDEPV